MFFLYVNENDKLTDKEGTAITVTNHLTTKRLKTRTHATEMKGN